MLPRYGEWAASSRLRVLKLAEAVNNAALARCVVGPIPDPDVVYMQKLASPDIVRGHRRALYDFDDIWDASLLADAASAVQAFTSDTAGHGALAPKRWELLPDMIDYDPAAPMVPAPASALCWFGNYPNYESVSRLMKAAGEFCATMTISDKQVSDAPNVRWNYADFPADLRTCGTALLSHAGADRGKSANKMIAAVTLGVPCIVNESPAYEALARAVGLDWAIVRDARELRGVWGRLQDAAERKRYLDAIQPLVWELYRPETIARRFIEIAEALF